jgi:hypothetical protein
MNRKTDVVYVVLLSMGTDITLSLSIMDDVVIGVIWRWLYLGAKN